MSVPIKPLAGYVVLQPKEQDSKTQSGILLTEAAKEKTETMEVVAVGDNVDTIAVGDEVICKSYAGTSIEVDKVQYTVIKAEDILAIMVRGE